MIAPAEEFNDIAPLPSKSTVVAADKVVAPVPPSANDAVPSVKVSALTDVAVIASASAVTAVLSAEPRASVPDPFGSMVIFALPDAVVILTAASPAVISSALIALAETPVIPEPSPVQSAPLHTLRSLPRQHVSFISAGLSTRSCQKKIIFAHSCVAK